MIILGGNTLFKVDATYAEIFDKKDLNINLPENFPIYTYTFPSNISFSLIDGIKFNIKTSSNTGKIKILFVCDNVLEQRRERVALLFD